MTAADIVAMALGGQRQGRGYLVHCPCHDDLTPSLSVDDGEDGRLLVRCFADCDSIDVLRELAARGLLPDREINTSNKFLLTDP